MLISDMRNLIFKILLFLGIIIGTDKLFGMVMDSVLTTTEKGDWGKNNYFFNELKSDIVILGSSRAIHHYNPMIFSDTLGMSCYNCGEDGMGIFLMFARYKAISQRCCPKIVIYEVLPGFDILSEKDNLKYLKFLRPYIDVEFVDSIVNSISPLESWKLLSDAYRYNSCFVDIIAQRISGDPRKAKDYSYAPEDKLLEYEEIRKKDTIVIVDSLKLAYLEELVKCCIKSGTKLFFTASPTYKPDSDISFAPLKKLSEDNNIPFINYYCDTMYCNNAAFFADATHLNRNGAEKFSSMIASQIRKMVSK